MKFIVRIYCDEEDTWTPEEDIEFTNENDAQFFRQGFDLAIRQYASLPSNYTYTAEVEKEYAQNTQDNKTVSCFKE